MTVGINRLDLSRVNSLFDIEVYLARLLAGDNCLFGGWNFRFLFDANFKAIIGDIVQQSVVGIPEAEFETVFSPLQMVLNNWLVSLSWLSSDELYDLQMALTFFKDFEFEAPKAFSIFFKQYLITAKHEDEFIIKIVTEFESADWLITITRWQIVSMCVAEGFPARIIYGSLDLFFNLGFDAAQLTLDYVMENILIGDWVIDIDGKVEFEPEFDLEINFDFDPELKSQII